MKGLLTLNISSLTEQHSSWVCVHAIDLREVDESCLRHMPILKSNQSFAHQFHSMVDIVCTFLIELRWVRTGYLNVVVEITETIDPAG